jgi:hypothetical protein
MIDTFKIRECPLAKSDHKKDKRLYAHVDHHKDTICVAKAIWRLPEKHFYAIFAHEIGHLISPKKGEAEANEAMHKAYGITIRYKDSKWGDNLEYLDPKDIKLCKKLFTFE